MKASELRELDVEALRGQERDLEEQVFRLRLQQSMGQLESSIKARTLRRDLARVKTVLREKRA